MSLFNIQICIEVTFFELIHISLQVLVPQLLLDIQALGKRVYWFFLGGGIQ